MEAEAEGTESPLAMWALVEGFDRGTGTLAGPDELLGEGLAPNTLYLEPEPASGATASVVVRKRATIRQQKLDMGTTLQRLADLLTDQSDYDEEFLAPTQAAYDLAWKVVQDAYAECRCDAPKAAPAPIGDGGIFIQWGPAERYVRLLVPPDPAGAYIHRRDGEERETFREVTGTVLAAQLDWLFRE